MLHETRYLLNWLCVVSGVNFLLAKMASSAKPSYVISQDGDVFTMRTETTFKTTEVKFKLNEEIDETTGDGRKCKVSITQSAANLIRYKSREHKLKLFNTHNILTISDCKTLFTDSFNTVIKRIK